MDIREAQPSILNGDEPVAPTPLRPGDKAICVFGAGTSQPQAVADAAALIEANGLGGKLALTTHALTNQRGWLKDHLSSLADNGVGACVIVLVDDKDVDWTNRGVIAMNEFASEISATDATVVGVLLARKQSDIMLAMGSATICGITVISDIKSDESTMSRLMEQGIKPIEAFGTKGTTTDPAEAGLAVYNREQIANHIAKGVVVGRLPDGGYICAPREEHSLTVGMTGSGKTLSSVLPSILINGACVDHRPHMVIIDCKSDTFDQTAYPLQNAGYRIVRLDLSRSSTPHTWNPIGKAVEAIRDNDDIRAESYLAPLMTAMKTSVHSERDAYWENAAADLIKALIYVAANAYGREIEISLALISDLLDDQKRALRAAKMIDGKQRQIVERVLDDLPNSTRGCVLGSAITMLSPYISPTGALVCGRSTFEPEEIVESKKPVAVFITCPDSSSVSYPIATVFAEALYSRYIRASDERGVGGAGTMREIQVFWDEFARFPRLECMTGILAAGRSRKFFVHLFLQSLSQLTERDKYEYSEAQTIVEQMPTLVVMRSSQGLAIEELKNRSQGKVCSTLGLGLGEAWVCRFGNPAYLATSPYRLSADLLEEYARNSRTLLRCHRDLSCYLAKGAGKRYHELDEFDRAELDRLEEQRYLIKERNSLIDCSEFDDMINALVA